MLVAELFSCLVYLITSLISCVMGGLCVSLDVGGNLVLWIKYHHSHEKQTVDL